MRVFIALAVAFCILVTACNAAIGEDYIVPEPATVEHTVMLPLDFNATIEPNTNKPPTSTENEDAHPIKGAAIATLFVASLIVFAVVMVIPRMPCVTAAATEKVLSVASSFSAGVFLMVGVGHMLGEALDIMDDHFSDDVKGRFRPALVIVAVGYMAMMVLQRGIFGGVAHSHAVSIDEPSDKKEEPKDSTWEAAPEATCESTEEDKDSDDAPATTTTTAVVPVGSTEPIAEDKPEADPFNGSVTASLVALWLHSFIEGMALGLQTTRDGALLLFLAILAHQWAEDFAVAVQTGKAGYTLLKRFVFSLILAVGCPSGIAIGWIIEDNVPEVAVGFILAFSTGTFLFVACSDMLPNELPAGRPAGGGASRWTHLIMMFFGACVLYAIMILLADAE